MARIAREYGYTLDEAAEAIGANLVTSVLRVELFFDEEAGNWHYRVPALHINGGVTLPVEDAERDCLSAVAFALECDPRDDDTDALTLDVNVAPAGC